MAIQPNPSSPDALPPVPADVKQKLLDAMSSIAAVKKTAQEQLTRLNRGQEVEQQYERAIDFYEKIRNQAEDIGGRSSQ